MRNPIVEKFEARVYAKRKPLPTFRSGDTIRVFYRIYEGGDQKKFRLQPFEGVVTRQKRGNVSGSFTVRKIGAGGIGIERIFPAQSPHIDRVEVVASGIVRRSRLYYLRDLSGKAARIRNRFYAALATDKQPSADAGFGPEDTAPPAPEVPTDGAAPVPESKV